MLERIIAQLRAQSLRIGMGPDIHDLRDQTVLVPKSGFRGLPPNVFAGESKQVHEVILHGRPPTIHGRPWAEFNGIHVSDGHERPTRWLQYPLSIDVPSRERGVGFYSAAFGCSKVAEPPLRSSV